MAPIRVAVIGLSSSAKTSWASTAHLPYLLSKRGQSKFKIVALLNSSVQAAKDAISTYNLPSDTRTYGDPASLAADPEVDLVVCTTRVDKHYETIYPSVEAGKGIYSEWPLASNALQARELAAVAKKSGSKAMVGVQGRLAPIALKIRELLEEGRIGKVLSSEVRGMGGTIDRQRLPEGLSYFYNREIGGNPYTIIFAHSESSSDPEKVSVRILRSDNDDVKHSTSFNRFLGKRYPYRATSNSNGQMARSLTQSPRSSFPLSNLTCPIS